MGLLRFLLAAVLLGAASAKLLSGRAGRDALRSYGLRDERARAAVWASTIAVEAALAVGVAAGLPWVAAAAAAVFGTFASILALAVVRGLSGKPCGCFGSHSRIGWPAVARAALLAAGFAVVAFLPGYEPSTEAWLAAGLSVSLVGLGVLGVAVLALAREARRAAARRGAAGGPLDRPRGPGAGRPGRADRPLRGLSRKP